MSEAASSTTAPTSPQLRRTAAYLLTDRVLEAAASGIAVALGDLPGADEPAAIAARDAAIRAVRATHRAAWRAIRREMADAYHDGARDILRDVADGRA